MPIGLLTLLGGWKNAIVLGILLVIGLAACYYWNDYQSLQEDHKQLQADYNAVVSVNKANEEKLHLAQRQRAREEVFTQALIQHRNEREKTLNDKITMLQTIERPASDRLCPVHPAIERALTWLRPDADTDSGKISVRRPRSPDQPNTMPE